VEVVILAAGIGRRLEIDKENKLPKCLLKIKHDDTLLDLNLKNLLSLEQVTKIKIVTGFKYQLVEEYIVSKYGTDNKIQFTFNPDFAKNVIHSVKVGLAEVSESKHLLLINGDTIFHQDTFSKACEICTKNQSSITIFGCITNESQQDDVKLLTYDDRVEKIGKKIECANSVSSGAILFCNDGLDKYLQALKNEAINNFKTHHEILEFIRSTGYTIYFNNNGMRNWLEIDTKEDFSFAVLNQNLP
jgi:choline kinase